MPRRNRRDSNFRSRSHKLPPVQLGRFGPSLHPVRYQTRADSKRNDKIRMPCRGDAAKCRRVQMIVMIMTLEHQINRGEILEFQARRPMASRAKMREGLARSDQCGSHKMLMPSIWINTLECPTNVTRSSPRKTRLGGGGPAPRQSTAARAPAFDSQATGAYSTGRGPGPISAGL